MLKCLKDEFNCELWGFDISETAIEHAKKNLPDADLRVLDMMKADFPYKNNQFDLVITDATLIYADDNVIENVLREIKRVGGKYFLFIEFHAEKDGLDEGYYIYNYDKLLKELSFKNIKKKKITNWEGYCWEKYGYCIITQK